jgi:hypothetical protein
MTTNAPVARTDSMLAIYCSDGLDSTVTQGLRGYIWPSGVAVPTPSTTTSSVRTHAPPPDGFVLLRSEPQTPPREPHLCSTRTSDHAPFCYQRLGQQLDHPCSCNTNSSETTREHHPVRLDLEHGQTNIPTSTPSLVRPRARTRAPLTQLNQLPRPELDQT